MLTYLGAVMDGIEKYSEVLNGISRISALYRILCNPFLNRKEVAKEAKTKKYIESIKHLIARWLTFKFVLRVMRRKNFFYDSSCFSSLHPSDLLSVLIRAKGFFLLIS